MNIKARNIEGKLTEINNESLESFKLSIHGKVITPEDSEYDKARAVWNGMIDRRPALIVQCTGTVDVIRTVKFAEEHRLTLSVKGGGHNIAGRALENDVLLIDLSHLRYVHVNPEKRTATVSPGAILADVDYETQFYGLAVPMGINSTTGISGLTLGGGFGWLSRKYGMTIDNLISAEVVTVDGKRLVCTETANSDLFWAIRGGGGNFGIVTSFEFKLVNVGPKVMAGPVIFDINDAKDVFKKYREYCNNAPDELTVWSVLRTCPPFPFVDKAYHGKPVMILVGIYNGPLEEGEKILPKVMDFGKPIGNALGPVDFASFQKAFDPLLTPGSRNYWKTQNFLQLDDALIDILVEYAQNLPSTQTELFIAQMGGQTNRVGKNATAYPHRDVESIMNLHTRWENKEDDKKCIEWARKLYEVTKPFATGGSYVNFVSEGDDNPAGTYSENIHKLVEIKSKYDPNNVLRSNLNISPE